MKKTARLKRKIFTDSNGGVSVSSREHPVMCGPVTNGNHATVAAASKHKNPFQTYPSDWVRSPKLIDLDVVTLMSGRMYTFGRYLEGLKKLDYPRDRLHLLWYSNSRDPAFAAMAASTALTMAQDGWDIRFVFNPTIVPSSHALREIVAMDGVAIDHANTIANLYNEALDMTSRDVFFLEDDIVPDPQALKRLVAHTERKSVGYAGVPVYDRHSPTLFVWDIVNDGDGSFGGAATIIEPKGVKEIGLGGLACVLVKRWALEKLDLPIMKMWPEAVLPDSTFGGCDIVLCFALHRLGIKRVADFGVQCAHIDSHGVSH